MQGRGFEEEKQADYGAVKSSVVVGQVRRIAGIGPAYEVLALVDAARARIRVFESGEETTLKIDDILKDPITGTIP